MELTVFITVLWFAFFALQAPCTSLEMKLHASDEQAAKGVELSQYPSLPRKIRFTEEAVAVKVNDVHHSISSTKHKEHVSGKAYQKEEARLVHGSRGTRQEWVESGADISHYFSMDYTHVRRRRPIHNKSLPVGP
ncbi:probable root meristem growth factor 8 [Hibiscus syriacus]|uniref:probable root meristem growth factor 8 n=1 Tax=Hibiscus syriacus TaxID=106335 RepID=UPI0019242EB0|nr:probable root meristem growth factor 8 [Hibiscus syriacus]